VQIQIGPKLQASVWMGQRHAALDVVRHRFGSRVGKIVQRQYDYVIANADAPVLSPVSPEGRVVQIDSQVIVLCLYQRFVFTL
jgi:hypothetical protein